MLLRFESEGKVIGGEHVDLMAGHTQRVKVEAASRVKRKGAGGGGGRPPTYSVVFVMEPTRSGSWGEAASGELWPQ
jgi:hypothetical protein